MHNNKAVLEYWQLAAQYTNLMDFNAAVVCSTWQAITRDECLTGQLQNHEVINTLLQHGNKVLLAPIHWHNKNTKDHFVPFLLYIEITPDGAFKPFAALSLPIVPRNLLEPSELSNISLGLQEDFDNYFVLQAPSWFESSSDLTWENQYQYANQMLSVVTCGKWMRDLMQLGFEAQHSPKIFPFTTSVNNEPMNIKLLQNKAKVEIIAAERNSGKSTYAKQKIAESWIEAAVKTAPAPQIVWVQSNTIARYTSIFACAKENEIYDTLSNDAKTQQQIHNELVQVFNTYIKGKQFLRNWQDMEEKLANKYSDKLSMSSKIKQLQQQLKEAHARYRHMQVLQSIYLRQSELVSNWLKVLDVFSILQKQRLQRLYAFFKQNFPGEQVENLTQEEMNNLILEKVNRARHSERFIADSLQQATSDSKQQETITERLLQWGRQYDTNISSAADVVNLIQHNLWDQVLNLATKYWHAEFANNNKYEEFFKTDPLSIDLLIVEHSEYVDPMGAARLLAKSQRAIIMGQYAAICNPRFAVTVDYELCKHFRLANCDAEYEDLQFEGISAALGNLWNLATNGREADKTFTTLGSDDIEYEFLSIGASNAEFRGSKINTAEIDALHSWLLRYNPDPNDVCIYTSFSAQAQCIRQRLQSSKYANVTVQLINKPTFIKAKFSLFSSVYSSADPGPYCFDRGVEILDNLIANTLQKLVVFGDRRIFKPELHSAAGKFARLFIAEHNKKEEVETSHV